MFGSPYLAPEIIPPIRANYLARLSTCVYVHMFETIEAISSLFIREWRDTGACIDEYARARERSIRAILPSSNFFFLSLII